MQRHLSNDAIRPSAIIVMGVSGSGKSTLGQLLATTLHCPFVEGDELHDARSVAKMRAGEPLEDADRWPWLDRLGAALREAVAAGGLAVAACSALKYRYRQRLSQVIGVPTSFILLEANKAELARRIANRTGHYMPASLLPSQLEALERPDASERALTLDARLPPEALCEAARAWLALGANRRG